MHGTFFPFLLLRIEYFFLPFIVSCIVDCLVAGCCATLGTLTVTHTLAVGHEKWYGSHDWCDDGSQNSSDFLVRGCLNYTFDSTHTHKYKHTLSTRHDGHTRSPIHLVALLALVANELNFKLEGVVMAFLVTVFYAYLPQPPTAASQKRSFTPLHVIPHRCTAPEHMPHTDHHTDSTKE